MLNIITRSSVLLFAIVLGFSSCEKFYDKSYQDMDLLRHNFDTSTDFSQFKTFSMPDTLVFIVDTLYDGTNGLPNFNIEMDKNTNGEYSAKILNKIEQRLTGLGLQKVVEGQGINPDLSVVVSSMTLKQVSRFLYLPSNRNAWWGAGSWNRYYTWGVYTHYSSNNGMLSVDLLDVKNSELNQDDEYVIKSVWKVSYEGVVGPTYATYTERVIENIDQAFDKQNSL